MKELTGKIAVVTGAGSGIGRATAIALAREGCDLALVDLDSQRLDEVSERVGEYGRSASTHIVDVSVRSEMERLVQEVIDFHQRVNIVVNNAGVVTLGKFVNQPIENIEWVVNVNIWGVIHGCHLFLPHLLATKDGHIVNVSSATGLLAPPLRSTYTLTKHAVRGLSESLRQELRSEGVGVTCVYPLIISTNIASATRTSDKRLPENASKPSLIKAETPESVAEAIVQGIKKNKARVLVGRGMGFLDFCKRMAPALFDRVVASAQ